MHTYFTKAIATRRDLKLKLDKMEKLLNFHTKGDNPASYEKYLQYPAGAKLEDVNRCKKAAEYFESVLNAATSESERVHEQYEYLFDGQKLKKWAAEQADYCTDVMTWLKNFMDKASVCLKKVNATQEKLTQVFIQLPNPREKSDKYMKNKTNTHHTRKDKMSRHEL